MISGLRVMIDIIPGVSFLFHLGCIAFMFIQFALGRPAVLFFCVSLFFQSSHVGPYDTLTLHCMPRSRCVDDGLRNGARPHPAPHRGVELAINCTSHRQTIAHTNAAASAHPSHRCVYT